MIVVLCEVCSCMHCWTSLFFVLLYVLYDCNIYVYKHYAIYIKVLIMCLNCVVVLLTLVLFWCWCYFIIRVCTYVLIGIVYMVVVSLMCVSVDVLIGCVLYCYVLYAFASIFICKFGFDCCVWIVYASWLVCCVLFVLWLFVWFCDWCCVVCLNVCLCLIVLRDVFVCVYVCIVLFCHCVVYV